MSVSSMYVAECINPSVSSSVIPTHSRFGCSMRLHLRHSPPGQLPQIHGPTISPSGYGSCSGCASAWRSASIASLAGPPPSTTSCHLFGSVPDVTTPVYSLNAFNAISAASLNVVMLPPKTVPAQGRIQPWAFLVDECGEGFLATLRPRPGTASPLVAPE